MVICSQMSPPGQPTRGDDEKDPSSAPYRTADIASRSLDRITGWPREESDLITKNKDPAIRKGPVQSRDAKER